MCYRILFVVNFYIIAYHCPGFQQYGMGTRGLVVSHSIWASFYHTDFCVQNLAHAQLLRF